MVHRAYSPAGYVLFGPGGPLVCWCGYPCAPGFRPGLWSGGPTGRSGRSSIRARRPVWFVGAGTRVGAYCIRPTGRPGTGRMHVPGRSSIRARGPVWWAYAIRPYTGYVHSVRASLRAFGPLRGRQGTRVGAYCIRPPGAPARGGYTSPGMIIHPLRDVWWAYAIRPYTGYVHSARAFGPFRGRQGTRVGAYCIRPTGRHHRWRMCHRGTCIRYVRRHSGPEARLEGVCDTPLP